MNDVKAYEIYCDNGSYTNIIAKDEESLKEIVKEKCFTEKYISVEVSLESLHLSELTAGDLLRLLK